jgi:hypothetical protein
MQVQLFCPFRHDVSPHAEAVQERSVGWARRFGLVARGRERSFAGGRFGWLAAHTFPEAELEILQLVADWTTWLFALDDTCDRAPDGKRPELLQRHVDDFMAVLNGLDGVTPSPLVGALTELRARLVPHVTPAWMSRFLHSSLQYFEACVWEAENRARGVVPREEPYKVMRRFAGAVHTYLDLMELASRNYLPLDLRKDVDAQRLAQAANNVACWSNDVYSAKKELGYGDVHNLVVVLMHERTLGFGEALALAVGQCDDEVRSFITIERALCERRAGDVRVTRYCGGLRAIMRGNIEWSLTTRRYDVGKRAA